jgi:hypothetical protein
MPAGKSVQGLTEQTHSSVIVRINSKDRTSTSNSSTDFKVALGKEISDHNVKRVVLRSLNMPNFQYNVNSNNNRIQIESGADGVVSIQVAEGQYKTSELITLLEGLFNASFTNNLTITQNSINQLLTFSIDNGDTIRLFAPDETNNTLNTNLGITTTTALASTHDGNRMVRLNGLTLCHVESSELANSNYHSDQRNENFLATVQVVNEFGTYLYYEPSFSEINSINYPSHRKFHSIDIRLLDQDLNVIDIHNYNVEIEIIFYYLD